MIEQKIDAYSKQVSQFKPSIDKYRPDWRPEDLQKFQRTMRARHPQKNGHFVEAFRKANPGMRPNFMSVGGYDGMHLIYEALKKTGGKADGDSLVAAMKGMSWESPRGPITIDPDTRDIIQNIYMRKVEKVGNELYNVEFATFEAVKDPAKAAKK